LGVWRYGRGEGFAWREVNHSRGEEKTTPKQGMCFKDIITLEGIANGGRNGKIETILFSRKKTLMANGIC